MGIRFAHDPIGDIRGKAGCRQIEAAPEEMHRVRLADQAAAKFLRHPVNRDQNSTEPMGVMGIIACVGVIRLECTGFDTSAGVVQILTAVPAMRARP